MKKTSLIILLCSMVVILSCNKNNYFRDAIALWSLSDLNDNTIENSQLKTHGEVKFVRLKGEEASASKIRGGDGVVSQFINGWFDAGQGYNDELNISGKGFSILVRMKAESINDFTPLISKTGSDQNIAYAISLRRTDDAVYVESKIGSDDIGGAHLLKYRIPDDELTIWHDILFRFNGKKSELYVDGLIRDDEVTVGEIRDWNRRPVLIGANYKPQYGYTDYIDGQVESRFDGLIDHVVIWNRYISDNQLMKISAVKDMKDGRPEYYNEKYRPQFHFTAKKNWINDPNGLVYYDGIYHMFFQYMPPHRPGAYKDWGHAISKDLVHWEQIPDHITPHKVWAGCWSGSSAVDLNNSSGFQVGDKKAIIAFITNGGNPNNGIGPKNTQCIAYSTDGGFTFTYYDQNPVIHNIYNSNRDPKVVWDEDSEKWIMSLYMDKAFDFGLFSSSDLKTWKHLSTVSLEGVAECPGFEPLPVDGNKSIKKWLFFGANGNYMIGSFDGTNFVPETKVLRADYGKNFYAAQTWSNSPDGRCIHIAWMPTRRYPGMPFEQQMNFPTELTLRSTNEGIRVFREPVDEIKNLYVEEFKLDNIDIKAEDNLLKNLSGELYDFNFEVEPTDCKWFEIGIRGATIHYDVLKEIISCGGPSVQNNIIPENWRSDKTLNVDFSNNLGEAPLEKLNGRIKLRILVDRTTIEVFGNDGRIVITSCFMPDENNKSYFVKSDKELKLLSSEIHSLKSAWSK